MPTVEQSPGKPIEKPKLRPGESYTKVEFFSYLGILI